VRNYRKKVQKSEKSGKFFGKSRQAFCFKGQVFVKKCRKKRKNALFLPKMHFSSAILPFRTSKYIGKQKRGVFLMEEAKSKRVAALYQKGMSRKDAVAKLIELLKNNDNRPVIIKSIDGEEAYLSKTSIGKLISNAAVAKSMDNGFTKEQHYAVASDIDNLFENSIKILSHSDKYKNPDVKAMHRFTAPIFGDNVAYITVKEATEHGKRIYSVELVELGKLEGMLEEAKLNSATFPTSSSPTSNIQN
jgi:hypothetical protein